MNKRSCKRLAAAVALWIGFASAPYTVFAAPENNNAGEEKEDTMVSESTQTKDSLWWAKDEENNPPADTSTATGEEEAKPVMRPAKINGPWWTRTDEDVELVSDDDKSAETQEKSEEVIEKPSPESIDLSKAKDVSEPDPNRAAKWGETRPEEDTIAESLKSLEDLTVVDVVFDGATKDTYATARTAINTRTGSKFSSSKILEDREAILGTGYFYDAYPGFERVPEGVIVTYHVLENPVLTDISFSGNAVETDDTINELITMETGTILNSNLLRENMTAITDRYKKDGYILAKITDMNIDQEGKLTLKINEGLLEGYKVKGNKKTKDSVILREMRQKTGEPFNANLARRSVQRVYNLGFFETVNVKMNPGVEPNGIELELDVKEKRTGSFGIGAGYSSADGIIGMISISDTNFNGRGDAVRISYERSGNDEDAHGYVFSYRHPWIDRHETAATLKLYNRTYDYNDYDTNGDLKEEYMRKYSGGELVLSRPVSEYSTNYITFKNRKDSYVKHLSSGNMGNRSGNTEWLKNNFGTTRSIILEHVTDTRDNIYEPTSGGRVSISGEFAGLGGDFSFQKYTIDDQRYMKVGHAQVVALRGQYGFGRGDISEFNQYRMGGQDSLRGYRDDQFRGNRMILTTVEYRFPIMNKVQGAIFTDWGGAWDSGLMPKGTHASIGAGLSLNTPIGPLRVDYGYGSQGGRVHFNVGGTF